MEDTWRLSDIFDANSEMIPGKYPTLLIGNNANNHSNYWDSSFWKYNVRYLKLRNLEFGYTFPKEWLQKCRINSLRLYLAGQNLFNSPMYLSIRKFQPVTEQLTRVCELSIWV